MTTSYRNAEYALVGELRRLLAFGREVSVRRLKTRELLARSFVIERPQERFIAVPGRRNSIPATIAETMWVLAGRDDVEFLLPYLPRAKEFSDDGQTWRGAYGPRLRDWHGVDQVEIVRSLLTQEPTSRRGVISLFNPQLDHDGGLDVPCNNWLHFVVRDGLLDLFVAVRSNDVIWGFSGINTFEWSVLHELMARWTGTAVGRQHWFVSSMHLYERHFGRASEIVRRWAPTPLYDDSLRCIASESTWREFPEITDRWFEIESRLRLDPTTVALSAEDMPDPLFRGFLEIIKAHWMREYGAAIQPAPPEYAGSDIGTVIACMNRPVATVTAPAAQTPSDSLTGLRAYIIDLHRAKSSAYGDSWKRRGELVGVLANIARKVDRLTGGDAAADGESALDTLIDLYVYLLKYQTYLADQDPTLGLDVFDPSNRTALSDGTYAFELLVQHSMPSAQADVDQVIADFEHLHRLAEGDARLTDRYALAGTMSADVLRLVVAQALTPNA